MTRTFGLRAALTFLVLIAIAPVFGVVVQASLAEQQGRVDRAEASLRSVVDLGAAHQERLVEGARLMLAAVANSPPVYGNDVQLCAAYMKKLQAQFPQGYGTFGLLDAGGRLTCRAMPAPTAVVSSDRLFFRTAVDSGRFSIGEFTLSRASGKPVLTFGFPVYGEGESTARGVAYLALDVGQADENLRKLTLAPGMRLLVADRNAVVIAAAGPGAATVGTKLPEQFLRRAVMEGGPLSGRSRGNDGEEWMYAVRPIGRASEGMLYVAGTTSRTDVVAPTASRLQVDLAVLGLITLLAASLAWIFGDRVVAKPIRRLLGRVDALAHEEVVADSQARPGALLELRELDSRVDDVARRLVERSLQRDAAMADMAHQRNLLGSVFESMSEGVLVVDPHGRVLHMNSAAQRILSGLGELAARNEFFWLAPDVLGIYLLDGVTLCPAEQRPVARAVAGVSVENFRYRIRGLLTAGEERVIQGSALPLKGPDGRRSGAVVAFFDITAAWRAEQDLRDSERRYRTLFESNPHPMWVFDCDTLGFITVNDAALAHYGYSREEFLAMTIADIRPRQDLSALQDALEMLNPMTAPRPWRHRLKDGRLIWVEISSHSLDYHGRPARMVLAHDITKLLETQRALQHLNETLEGRVTERTRELAISNRELETFSYSVSHDLRAPLQVIDGFGRALLARHADRLDVQAQHYLTRIRENTRQMGKLIDDLLSLARVTRTEIRAEPVDLAAKARGILERLQLRFPERDVEVAIDQDIVCSGDPILLTLVMENLLENAWKFTSRTEAARLKVTGVRDSSGCMVVSVADNGAGFDMAHTAKLFNPFQRLHAAAEFEGTGIGLATVHRIITRHGGRVWAESSPGQGAAFHFTLKPGAGNEKQSDTSGRGQPRSPGAHPDDVGREQCAK